MLHHSPNVACYCPTLYQDSRHQAFPSLPEPCWGRAPGSIAYHLVHHGCYMELGGTNPSEEVPSSLDGASRHYCGGHLEQVLQLESRFRNQWAFALCECLQRPGARRAAAPYRSGLEQLFGYRNFSSSKQAGSDAEAQLRLRDRDRSAAAHPVATAHPPSLNRVSSDYLI